MTKSAEDLRGLLTLLECVGDTRVIFILEDLAKHGGRVELKPNRGGKTLRVEVGAKFHDPQLTIRG